MMLKLKCKKRVDTTFGLISAADIMSLLLMLCMQMISGGMTNTLNVDMPTSKSTASADTHINVVINSNLEHFIDTQLVNKDEILEILLQKSKQGKNELLITIDKNIPVQHLIFVADAATCANMKVAVSTKPD